MNFVATLVSAISLGASATADPDVHVSIRRTYGQLRSRLYDLCRCEALSELEAQPESYARRLALSAELRASAAVQDPWLASLAEGLIELVRRHASQVDVVPLGRVRARGPARGAGSPATPRDNEPGAGFFVPTQSRPRRAGSAARQTSVHGSRGWSQAATAGSGLGVAPAFTSDSAIPTGPRVGADPYAAGAPTPRSRRPRMMTSVVEDEDLPALRRARASTAEVVAAEGDPCAPETTRTSGGVSPTRPGTSSRRALGPRVLDDEAIDVEFSENNAPTTRALIRRRPTIEIIIEDEDADEAMKPQNAAPRGGDVHLRALPAAPLPQLRSRQWAWVLVSGTLATAVGFWASGTSVVDSGQSRTLAVDVPPASAELVRDAGRNSSTGLDLDAPNSVTVEGEAVDAIVSTLVDRRDDVQVPRTTPSTPQPVVQGPSDSATKRRAEQLARRTRGSTPARDPVLGLVELAVESEALIMRPRPARTLRQRSLHD